MAKQTPSSRLADSYQTYPTAQAAAVAALRGIDNKQYERGGGVLYNKEQNVYAATEPAGRDDGTHFEAKVGVPKGWQLQSTYHTHPSGALSTQFSDNDIDTAKQLKAPSYVLARDDNKIRVFDPASSKVQSDTGPGGYGSVRYALGSMVDETPPTPPPVTTTAPAATPPPPPAVSTPATTTSISGSRITMKDFANRSRATTTKYKPKVVHIKIGAPKRP